MQVFTLVLIPPTWAFHSILLVDFLSQIDSHTFLFAIVNSVRLFSHFLDSGADFLLPSGAGHLKRTDNSTKPPLRRIKLWTFWKKKSSWSSAILSSRDVFTEIPSVLELKAGFHKQKSRSSNQKRRAYDLVKTALPIPPTTPSLTFRLWSSEKQIVGVGSWSGRTKPVTKRTHGNVHCDWFIFPLPLPTPTI